jgi:hypothetical protein
MLKFLIPLTGIVFSTALAGFLTIVLIAAIIR